MEKNYSKYSNTQTTRLVRELSPTTEFTYYGVGKWLE